MQRRTERKLGDRTNIHQGTAAFGHNSMAADAVKSLAVQKNTVALMLKQSPLLCMQ